MAGYENAWHHDVTWREIPSMGAILHAIQVPAIGGDTLFADMYAAHEGLPDELRAEVEDLDLVHTFEHTFGAFLSPERRAEMLQRYPPPTHPMVCTHDATGREHLYANRNFVSHIAGRTREESSDLIDRVCRQADHPEYQCRFTWETPLRGLLGQPRRPALRQQRLLARAPDHGVRLRDRHPPPPLTLAAPPRLRRRVWGPN